MGLLPGVTGVVTVMEAFLDFCCVCAFQAAQGMAQGVAEFTSDGSLGLDVCI